MTYAEIKPILSFAGYMTLVMMTGLLAGVLAILALSSDADAQHPDMRSFMEREWHHAHADRPITPVDYIDRKKSLNKTHAPRNS